MHQGTSEVVAGADNDVLYCKRCGKTLEDQLWWAIAVVAGGKPSWNVNRCPDGEEHLFVKGSRDDRQSIVG